MAGNFNRIILVGNLTRDPEIRYVQSGSAVTKFSLAVNRHTKNGDDTTFVDIVAWDNGNYKLAETCNSYLKKGSSVLVEGRLVIRSYDDKEGNKRKATEVVIDTMQMLGAKQDGNRSNGDGAHHDNVRPFSKSARADENEINDLDSEEIDSEIPF